MGGWVFMTRTGERELEGETGVPTQGFVDGHDDCAIHSPLHCALERCYFRGVINLITCTAFIRNACLANDCARTHRMSSVMKRTVIVAGVVNAAHRRAPPVGVRSNWLLTSLGAARMLLPANPHDLILAMFYMLS